MRPPASGILAAMRRTPRLVRFGAPVLGLVLLLAACSGGGGKGNDASKHPSTTEPSASTIPLHLGTVSVETLSGATQRVPASVQRAVMRATQRYVDAATLSPLQDGKPAPHLQQQFLLTVSPRTTLHGADRGVLTDDAMGRATAALDTTAKPVRLAALGDGNGKWLMMGATIDYTVKTRTKAGPVLVRRYGDLYFTPDHSGWIIAAYNIGVARETPGAASRGHAHAGPTSTTGKAKS
jgi:hypothetical protein